MNNIPDQTKQKYRQALEDLFNGEGGFAIIYDVAKMTTNNIVIDIDLEILAKIVVDIVYNLHEDKNKIKFTVAKEQFINYINKFIAERNK